MTEEQEARAIRYAHIIEKHLRLITDGCLPLLPHIQIDLEKRRKHADWELGYLLSGLVEALPEDLRVSVQACLDLNAHVWSKQYQHVYDAAQKEASPVCLAAVDSL